MNDNIKKLAKQSGYQEGFRWAMEDLSMNTFAKLIIAETLGIVKDEVNYHINYDTADNIEEMVNKHFGVK